MAVILTFSALLGLIVGSFVNVVIYRLPRGESLAYPPSHCPACNQPLQAVELIPVVSWLLQKGRCRHCGGKISPRYPLIEVITAVAFFSSVYILGLSLQAVFAALMLAALLAVSAIDLEYRRIPNALVTVILIIALLDLAPDPSRLTGRLTGAALGGGFLLLLVLITRGKGMGMGDVKLMTAVGLYLGLSGTAVALGLSFIIGAITGGGLLAAGVIDRRRPVPFGPFLALGSALSLFWGQVMVTWYFSLLGV